MDNKMRNFYEYIISEFPTAFETHFSKDLLYNILKESQKIECMAERCDWLKKILPQVQVEEIRDILLK